MYGFYIDTSIHQIGYIIELIVRLGGILYTNSKTSFDIIQGDFSDIKIKLFLSTHEIIQEMIRDEIKVLILQDFHYKIFRVLKEKGIKFVQVFHGTSDKTYNTNREILSYDLVCLSGEKMVEDIKRKGLNKTINCIVTGNPKADRIFNKSYERETEIVRLGLNPHRKNVLYAPTWMDGMGNSSFKKFGLNLPDYFPEEYQLTIKLHPNLFLYQLHLIAKLKRKIEKKKNILLLEDGRKIYDIIPILAASDALITDVSGVSHEYIAFLRPMIFLDNRSVLRFFYGKGRKRIWKTGDVVCKLKDLPDIIRINLKNPDRHRKVQEDMLREIYSFSDGRSVERISNAIKSLE